jgi:hypothetical protein
MDNIIKIGQIVKCIRGAIGLLENGKEYTIYGVTNSGNYLLMEVDPPTPCNCFDSSRFELSSNEVLSVVSKDLLDKGYKVELSKKEKINVPVLYGVSNSVEKSFDVDAYNQEKRFVIEVEAGRALLNNQFLKDLFQACVMVDVDYLAIAVRKVYKEQKDFETITKFFETLYASDKLTLPLKGILLIGY